MVSCQTQRSASCLFDALLVVLERIPFAFVIFYAVWTIDCHIAMAFRLPYWLLNIVFWKALLLSIAAVIYTERNDETHALFTPAQSNFRPPDRFPLIFLAIFCLTSLSIVFGTYVVTWGILLCSGLCISYFLRNKNTSADIPASPDITSPAAVTALLLLILFTILFTTSIVRTNSDDAYYLSMIVQVIENQNAPTLFYEPMYGLLENKMAMLRRVHTYEILSATLSHITRIDHLFTYYIVLPAISCALYILTSFVILKRLLLTNAAAVLGTIFSVAILIAWGDAHRTLGNSAFVRFFQGKTLLVHITIPMLLYLTWRFLQTKKHVDLLTLSLCACAATGLSVNGILLAPSTMLLAFCGAFLANPKILVDWKICFRLPLAFLYPVMLGLVIKLNPGGGEIIEHFGRELKSTLPDTTRILGILLGDDTLNIRSAAALAALAVAPLAVSSYHYRKLVLGFTLACILLLFLPGYPVHKLIAKFASSNFIWRLSWICPFPILMGLIGGAAANVAHRRQGLVFLSLVLTIFFAAPYNWTFSKENNAMFQWQPHKLNSERLVTAQQVIALTGPTGRLLAPQELTVIMTGLRSHPELTYVRSAYLSRLSKTEKQDIEFLHSIVVGRLTTFNHDHFLSLVQSNRITSIVFKRENGLEKGLREDLQRHGFRKLGKIETFEIWSQKAHQGVPQTRDTNRSQENFSPVALAF